MIRSAVSVLLLACTLSAQGLPPNLSTVQVFTNGMLGVGPVGAIEFDPTGNTLYASSNATLPGATIQALPVLRNPQNNRITGFGSPAFVTNAPLVDAGLQLWQGVTLIWSTWPSHTMGEAVLGGGASSTFPLGPTGAPASTGGLEFVPSGLPNAGDLLVSSYETGALTRITFTIGANGIVTPNPASASNFAMLPAGTEGFRHIPSGPDRGSILVANYNTGVLSVLQTNATTGEALLDPMGQPILTPLITGLVFVDGLAFDPVTNDLFVTVFDGVDSIYHFTGFPPPGAPQAAVSSVGSGCTGISGVPAQLAARQLPFLGNAAFSFRLSGVPTNTTTLLYPSTGFSASPLSLGGGCDVYIDIPGFLFLSSGGLGPFGPVMSDTAGMADYPIPIPNAANLAGATLAFQALAVDASTLPGLVLSNGIQIVLN